ncbi:SET domain-containing protein [Auricularia subglabra TFB-10046 SS5]|nr:SET domain-containing protein [Auricularia subglabra TFB-10046 SS5]
MEVLQDDSGSIYVRARTSIPAESTLVAIPKRAIISARTSPVPELRNDPSPDSFTLAAVLLVEMQKGLLSPYFGYLQSLPAPAALSIGHLWDPEQDAEALQWLEGTPALDIIRRSNVLAIARTYFRGVVQKLDELDDIGEDDYLHAYALVSSRSFVVDAYHGLSMVPIADAFNHTNAYTVQMQSDHDVCTTCGSLSACPHPRDDVPDAQFEDTCDMVTTSPIRAGDEIFNTYDPTGLSNADLLARYGFVLPGNGTGVHCALDFSVVRLEELLRDTPSENRSVRLALQYVLEERRALEQRL